MKKTKLIPGLVLLVSIMSTQSAFADAAAITNAQKIDELKKSGILVGDQNGDLQADAPLTYAAGTNMLVKGLGLTIDVNFIKKPEASDYYTNLKNNVWYSDAFITASHNMLDIPKDVQPAAEMTREQFAHHLFKSLQRKGEFAFIQIFKEVADQDAITPAYSDSIQKLVITNLVELDKEGRFNPKQIITRKEAAAWLYNTIEFVKDHTDKEVEKVEK